LSGKNYQRVRFSYQFIFKIGELFMSDLPVLPDLSDQNDARPLPLIVAEKWNFPLAYVKTENVILYAVQDWIRGLTSAKEVKTIWADIKRRTNLSQWLDSIQPLPYVASDGKTYQRDFTDDKGLYLIAQHLRVTKARPVLDAIKKYLAEAGVFVDEARRDPGAAAEVFYEREYRKLIAEGFTPEEAQQWLDVRFNQKRTRRFITAVWSARGINKPRDFADLTNLVHRVALGMTATRHKRQLAIKDTPRNYISAADNATIQVTELTSGLLHEHRESLGKAELSEDIEDVRPVIDAARPELQRLFSSKPRRLPGQAKAKLPDEV
jgi:hypothetical protein